YTSKSDNKIPLQRVFYLNTTFTTNSTISITIPSAAATIEFGSGGTIRSGSRKNATVKKNSNKQNKDNHTEKNVAATATSAKNAKIQRASKSVCKRINGPTFGA